MPSSAITCKLIPENRRLSHTEKVFGLHFPLALEPTIYAFADRLSEDYQGGYWAFQELSNGGFYMAPQADAPLKVCCDNGYEGELSGDAFGIVCCLYTYSHLSFSHKASMAEIAARHFHRLREYALDHPEARAIFAAID